QASGVPIHMLSEDPGFVRVRRRLDSFSRTLWFDRRGRGASEGDWRDSIPGQIFDADLIALLNAVRSQQPAVVGVGLSGPAAIHFSVTHPERVSALVLINTFAHYVREGDYRWGVPREDVDRRVAELKEESGRAPNLELVAPSRAADERFRAWYARARR